MLHVVDTHGFWVGFPHHNSMASYGHQAVLSRATDVNSRQIPQIPGHARSLTTVEMVVVFQLILNAIKYLPYTNESR